MTIIKPIVVHIKRVRVADKIAEKALSPCTKGLQSLIETMEKKWSQEEKNSPGARPSAMARVVKPAKVSSWTKSISLDTYTKQPKIWHTSNVDVPESTEFQDLMVSLMVNKERKGLERFVSELVLTTLSTPEKQKIKEVIKCLEDKYGRTRQEKLEELVMY